MRKWMVRSEDDSAVKCVVEAETRFDALQLAAAQLGLSQDNLLAAEWPF